MFVNPTQEKGPGTHLKDTSGKQSKRFFSLLPYPDTNVYEDFAINPLLSAAVVQTN